FSNTRQWKNNLGQSFFNLESHSTLRRLCRDSVLYLRLASARACNQCIERALASQSDRRSRSIPTTHVSPSCIVPPVRPTSPASGEECASPAPPSACASPHQSSHPARNW